MTDAANIPQKSLRIRLPSGAEPPSPSPPAPTATPRNSKPKSILKNRDESNSPPSTTIEPDPLQSESYFRGPFRTIVASVENANEGLLSTHDITEAYVLLSCRIESQASNLGDVSAPAVAAVRALPSHIVCAAIRRDVAVAIPGPQHSEDVLSGQERLDDERRSYVKDRSSLCHACLRFLASFFRFPSLHGFLKLHELAWILKETIDIGLSHGLSTINPPKTYSHIITVISNQRLPDSVLRPFRPKLGIIVERAASGAMGGNAASGPHIGGLRATYCLLYRHGPLLLPEFSKVLKIILQNLVCPVPAFRELACKSLAGFAHATLRNEIAIEDQVTCSAIVGAFIDKEVQRAKGVDKRDPGAFVLRDFLKLREDDPQVTQQVARLLNVTSSLLILSGPYVFSRPNSLKFLVKAIGKTQPFRQREMNQLRSATWSCLVRAYGLLFLWDAPRDSGLEESAFKIVRQEYREDVAVSVIAVLLGPFQGEIRRLDQVREAITYLYHLGEMPETRGMTASLFRRLLGGVLNDADCDMCTWTDPASIVPHWLSDGSTLGLEPRRLRRALAALPGADIHVVRILEADELLAIWEPMVEAFRILAIGQLFDQKAESALQSDTMLLWHALLRIQSSLEPSFARDVVSKEVLACLASTLIDFLEAAHVQNPIRLSQSLTATLQLWTALNEELGEIWASAVAASIYRRLLKAWQFDLANGIMSDEWAHLSRTLVLVAPKRTLEVLSELHDAAAERVVWLDMVRHVRFMEHPSTEVISSLLLFPIQATEHLLRDDMDFSYWDILFMLGLMHDEPDNIFTLVAEAIQRALSVRTCSELRSFMTAFVSHASRSDTPPNPTLISVTSDYLEEAYPPETHEDNELTQIIPALQRIINAFPSIATLTILQHGIIPWFQDRGSLIPDSVYNNDILPLYCDILTVIRKLVPAEDVVVELAKLLAAPFARRRIPEPAIGPVAFKEFWDEFAPTLDFRSRDFPAALADCVVCLYSAYGCFIPEWLESQLESQGSRSSVVGEVIPPSVEDIETSDFSPISSDRRAMTRSDQDSPSRCHEKTSLRRTSQLSPSLGDPSPLFAHARHKSSLSPGSSNLDERVKKKPRTHPISAVEENDESYQIAGVPRHPTLSSSSDVPDASSSESDALACSPDREICQQNSSRSQSRPERDNPNSDEDYSLWEIPVASQGACEITDDEERTPRPSPERRVADVKGLRVTPNAAHGPSYPFSPEYRFDRSQTAPAALQFPEHHLNRGNGTEDDRNGHAKLRRTHTTSDVPLDALEKLHARLSEDANYMETQDLAQATKLTYDVLGILNGKISEKLESRK